MALPVTKIVLAVFSIGVVVALGEAGIVIYRLNSIWIAKETIMFMSIWDIINYTLAAVSLSSYCIWNFSDIRLPILVKSHHSNVAIESVSNADLVFGCCMVFFVNFCESIGR